VGLAVLFGVRTCFLQGTNIRRSVAAEAVPFVAPKGTKRRAHVSRNASFRTGLCAQSGKTTGCSILSQLIVRAGPSLQKVLLCPSLHTAHHRFA